MTTLGSILLHKAPQTVMALTGAALRSTSPGWSDTSVSLERLRLDAGRRMAPAPAPAGPKRGRGRNLSRLRQTDRVYQAMRRMAQKAHGGPGRRVFLSAQGADRFAAGKACVVSPVAMDFGLVRRTIYLVTVVS